MRSRDKIAITVDPDLLAQVERLRRRLGTSRSAVFERAVEEYLANAAGAEKRRTYAEAYRRHPETAAESRAALATATIGLAGERWDATR